VLADATGAVLWVVGLARSSDVPADGVDSVFEIMVADGDTA
jgi:hypothetical protein